MADTTEEKLDETQVPKDVAMAVSGDLVARASAGGMTAESAGAPEREAGEETEEEEEPITEEEHALNIAVTEEFLEHLIDLAAEGKLPEKKEKKSEFMMRRKTTMSEDMIIEEEVVHEEDMEEVDMMLVARGILESVLGEEEAAEEETASLQEAWTQQQQLMVDFDAAHDEAQQLRLMNLLLQAAVQRAMQRHTKAKTAPSVSMSRTVSTPVSEEEEAKLAAELHKELLEAGEVRRQLNAELSHGAFEDELQNRLSAARQELQTHMKQLQQLQDTVLSRLRTTHMRRQEAERLLKQAWPQLQRLQKERLRYTHAAHELHQAKEQVAHLEEFGLERTVGAYEQLVADGVKLHERDLERTEQLTALRAVADRDLQEAAHLREAVQGAREIAGDARRSDIRAIRLIRWAREDVLKAKKERDLLYKKSEQLTQELDLLAYPPLLRHQEEERRQLQELQTKLEQLRATYVLQERSVVAAREMVKQWTEGGNNQVPSQKDLFE